MTIPVSPLEQVRAQLARQKWAVDTRDADALKPLYTADSGQVIYQGGRAAGRRSPPVLKGYLAYDDRWVLDAGEWRLGYRETVMYG